MSWRVEILNDVVKAELEELPRDIRVKVTRILDMMVDLGPLKMREPLVKPLKDKLWEIRMSGRDGIARAIYVLASQRRIVVLHAFVKKTQKNSTSGHQPGPGQIEGNPPMTIPFEQVKQEWLQDPAFKAEYDAFAPEFEIATELLRARLRAELSQADVAARMGTSRSTIARLESGRVLPSTKTLLRFAEATGARVHIRLAAE